MTEEASSSISRAGYQTIAIQRDGAVDWLSLNRPERLNAINGQMVAELSRYFSGLQHDHTCRVVVLRGAGKGFCSGLDLGVLVDLRGQLLASPTEAEDAPLLSGVVLRMRACPQPIVALLHGAACGGGLILALAADIRIAGQSARMNVTFNRLGLSGCELGSSFFLPRSLCSSVANELMMTGRFIQGPRALATGLVSELVPDEDLEAAGRAMVGDMLALSPIGLRKTKETIEATSVVADLRAAIEIEERTQLECAQDPMFRAAIEEFASRSVRRNA